MFGRGVPAPRWSRDLPPLTLVGDSGRVDTIARGVLHRAFAVGEGPWVVHVLDVDRASCWSPVAVKGADAAAGRTKASELVASLGRTRPVAGGVNADFFLFDPAGVPTGLHVSNGRVISGPGARPVFAMDSGGRIVMETFTAGGVAIAALDSIPIVAWNRTAPAGLAWFDAGYGPAVDTATGSVRVVVAPGRGLVQLIDTGRAPTRIPPTGGVLVLGARVATPIRERFLLSARSRGRFDVTVRLMPFHPREAVGGFPVLVRDSVEVPGLDSAGAPTFAPVRHPRTIVGTTAGGRRLLLITIDGRQAGYSAGTTNRESARVALALGARDAINLDGGGSTTMVVMRQDSSGSHATVVNRPSDPQGERPVGNALAVVRSCDGRWEM